jgi:hypothetical protein
LRDCKSYGCSSSSKAPAGKMIPSEATNCCGQSQRSGCLYLVIAAIFEPAQNQTLSKRLRQTTKLLAPDGYGQKCIPTPPILKARQLRPDAAAQHSFELANSVPILSYIDSAIAKKAYEDYQLARPPARSPAHKQTIAPQKRYYDELDFFHCLHSSSMSKNQNAA